MSRKRSTPEKVQNKAKIQWLMQYVQLGIELKTLTDAYATYRAQLLGIRAQVITDMPMSKGYNKDKFSDALAKLEAITAEADARSEELNETRKAIARVINAIPNSKYRNIMILRYIRGKKWEQICVETGYSWRHIHRIHGESLKQVHIPIKSA